MAERKKRKDDTWTKEELSSALKHRDDRRDKKERPRLAQDAAHSSSDRRRPESKSARTLHSSDKDRKSKEARVEKRPRRREDEELERELRKYEREEEKKRAREEKHIEKEETKPSQEDRRLEKEERKREKEERRLAKEESKHLREERHQEREERRREKEERKLSKEPSKHSRDETRQEKEERRREREERRLEKEERHHVREEKHQEKEDRRREKEERKLLREESRHSKGEKRQEKVDRRPEIGGRSFEKEETKHIKDERHPEKEDRRREKEERKLRKEESKGERRPEKVDRRPEIGGRELEKEKTKHIKDERRSEKEKRKEKDERVSHYDKDKKSERYEKRQSHDSRKLEKDERKREKEGKRPEQDDKRLRPQEKEDSDRRRSGRDRSGSGKTKSEEASSHKDARSRDKDKRDKSRSKRSRENTTSESADEVPSYLSTKTNRREAESSLVTMVVGEEDEYNYDDEEFEDYEDDFEEEDLEEVKPKEQSSEVREIINAMRQENERVQSARTQSAMSDERPYLTSSPLEREDATSPVVGMTQVDFAKSKKGSKLKRISKQVMKRRNDLINLIQLDVISFDLFELAPVTEYNFYIQNFGSQNTRQIATQCNDDALEADTQTETPDLFDKWTQHPQDGALVCGGSQVDPHSSVEALLTLMREGSQRFGSFLNYASNLVETSFAEERYWSGRDKQGSILTCCESCTKFNTNLSYLQGRQILHTVFGEGGMMAISFGISNHQVAARLDSKGLITVWSGSNTEQPDKILVCDALPVTCCFAPKKKNLLFVGADDGSVLVYDLNEPSTMHQNREIEKNKMSVLRTPTYITGWQNDIHSSPIVCINLVGTFLSSNQIFSLDESARICIWTVVDILSSLDDDMGLAPLGRIKLVKTNPIDVTFQKSLSNQELGCRATYAICPDASVFYVGMVSGSVISVSRERKLKCYRSHSMGDVTSIAISSLNMMLMLVSYSDGTLALFQVKQESPVMTWSLGNSVLFCDWSNCRSSVFFALDSTNHIHVWDLMAMDSGPVVSDMLQKKTLRFCVDGYAKKSTDLMVAYDSCAFEVHRISSHFTNSVTSDEADHMVSLLLSFG